MQNILLVEDDHELNQALCYALEKGNYRVMSSFSMEEAEKHYSGNMPDLILLDVNLPDGSGFQFAQDTIALYEIPFIFLTAHNLDDEVIGGYRLGAEDYITKPFSLAILRARVAAALRRRREADAGSGGESEEHVVFDQYDFDFVKMLFHVNGRAVELSKTEQKLLRYFVVNRGITLSRSMLLDRVWSDGAEYVDENALSVAVNRLRDKLSARPYIKTVYGVGYIWVKE